jgi:REP element-mobilizing transposase RayT
MPRYLTLVENGIYHTMSRIVRRESFDDQDKDKLEEIIKFYTQIYFCTPYAFAVMDNHFHLIIEMHNTNKTYSLEEIKARYKKYKSRLLHKPKLKLKTPEDLLKLKKKWASLSELLKDIKQTFSYYYNRKNGRDGYLWRDRFKSVLLEKGSALLNCMAYIDLNAIRANVVKKPEDYKWSSFYYHVIEENKDNWLSLKFYEDNDQKLENKDNEELFYLYRKVVYTIGIKPKYKLKSGQFEAQGVIPDYIFTKAEEQDFHYTMLERLDHKITHFTNSAIMGSKEFIDEIYELKKELFKRQNKSNQSYSLKELKDLHIFKKTKIRKNKQKKIDF